MTIWLYCICRDEEMMMPYFLRHYGTFVDRMNFFDGGSTDRTLEIIAGCPQAICRPWTGSTGIVDDEFTNFANEQWKEARGQADWVIWVDADEFVYHPNILEVLWRYRQEGVEVPRIEGYTMLSDRFPTTLGQIYTEVKTGIPDNCWSKQAVFRGDIHYNMGRHSLNLDAFNPVQSATAELKLLHYRGLGLDYVKARHLRNWSRVPERCRQQNCGTNTSPGWTGHHGLDWFKERLSEPRKNVI